MRVNKELWTYRLIRAATWPLSHLSHKSIHRLGRWMGLLCFYLLKDYRKRTLSNLALAKDLKLSQKEIFQVAKESFQNLAINCLEYPRLARGLSPTIQCENPEVAETLYQQGHGIVFFCGHQSNWEVLFLDGTQRMDGVAIGKPIKNRRLYQWIVSIREQNGGKIIAPRNAIREGFKALKKGTFLGIVGDQGMPGSGYSFPFFGRRAWTSTAPALLSYRTNSPLIFAATRRVLGGYRIHYSNPIWPNLQAPLEEEVPRLMDVVLTKLQESIAKSPGEWLWQHNRWKQQTPQIVYKPYRYDCLCVILPEKKEELSPLLPHLATLKSIYPDNFLFLIVPEALRGTSLIEADEILYYNSPKEILLKDYRFKLIFNFTGCKKVTRHFLGLSAFSVLTLETLLEKAKPHLPPEPPYDLSLLLKKALCR